MTISRRTALALTAAALASAPRIAAAQSAPIRFGCEANEAYGEPFFGADGGIFANAGLNVEIQLFRGAGAMTAALAGGALDVALSDAILLANAANRGIPIVALAGSALSTTAVTTGCLCVAKNSTLKTPASFEGKTIAIASLASLTSISLKLWLQKGGAAVDKVRFIELPFSDMLPALARGTIAGCYMVEPLLTQNGSELQIVAVPYRAIADELLVSIVVASRSWVDQNREIARKIVTAVYNTARWANANPDATAPILAKYSKTDVDVIRRMHRSIFATSMEPALLQPVIDAGVVYKVIDKPVNAAGLIFRP